MDVGDKTKYRLRGFGTSTSLNLYAMEGKDKCKVCTETYNRTTRSAVSCPTCGYTACAKCIRRYLCTLKTADAACMDCRGLWGMEFLYSCFPRSFLNLEFRNHRANVLFEQELSRVPEVLGRAEKTKKYRTLLLDSEQALADIIAENGNKWITLVTKSYARDDDDNDFNNMSNRINRTIDIFLSKTMLNLDLKITYMGIIANICYHRYLTEDTDEARNIHEDFYKTYTKLRKIQDCRNVYDRWYRNTCSVSKKEFRQPCRLDGCLGMLTSAWHCGLCQSYVCSKCHARKDGRNDTTHVCIESDIQTAHLIANSTKPCPRCTVSIYKIDGCDQMWCTQCHVSFSWRSGEVINERVHNPHYLHWLREGNIQPREAGDVVCGGMPEMTDIRNALVRSVPAIDARKGWLENARKILELRMVVINPMHVRRRDLLAFENQRVAFILGDLTKKGFMAKIKRNDKAAQHLQETLYILETYCTVMEDDYRALVQSAKPFCEIEENMIKMREYTEEQLARVAKCYGIKKLSL